MEKHTKDNSTFINKFFQLESAGGILLMLSAALAMLVANSPLQSVYALLLDIPVEIRVGALEIAKPLLLWINDGLMAIFFLLVGLELKRELVEGELSDPRNIILPGIGALGGMFIPAAIYVYFNIDDPVAMQGWAIPAATDIAFALGVLSLLGSRVPVSLKIFLTSLAIFDDIGAIIIIALFYTSKLSLLALAVAGFCLPVLFILNRRNVTTRSVYLFIGLIIWTAMLKSGVHATLAGVVLAIFIPVKSKEDPQYSPLKSLEHDLHPLVAYFILPVFAFVNAGVDLSGTEPAHLLHGLTLGISLGLVFGKQIGIFCLCSLAVVFRLTQLPRNMTFVSLYGVSALCGIGFTMSLFIGSLAFEETGVNLLTDERIGIIIGSSISGIIGYLILRYSLKKDDHEENP